LNGVFGKEVVEEEVDLFALPFGGLKEAAQDAMIFQALLGTGALDSAALDHHRTQGTLGQVVGGRYVGVSETGEEAQESHK
jgi:hypothetical protein